MVALPILRNYKNINLILLTQTEEMNMKLLITLAFMLSVLTACNFQETLKETGDTIQGGASNATEEAKDVPAGVSEASNKAEADVKD